MNFEGRILHDAMAEPAVGLPAPCARSARKLLVLDLDETLIHASEEPLDRPADFGFREYHVYKRPHLDAFLAYAFAHFDVGIWTSSGIRYAQEVSARILDVERLRFLWASPRCTLRRCRATGQLHPLKRLAKLKRLGYSLQQMIAVDDTPEKHGDNYGNLVRVYGYTGDTMDRELPMLADYLQSLAGEADVRGIEKRNWRERLIARAQGPQ